MAFNTKEEELNNSIPVSIAKLMTLAFRKGQDPKETYTKAAWFPAKEITKLSEKLVKFEADGVRIYFGRYTSEIIAQINKLPYGTKIPDSYVNRNTLLIVITKEIDGKAKTDYFISNELDAEDQVSSPTEDTDPLNRAELCPTLCDIDSDLMNP